MFLKYCYTIFLLQLHNIKNEIISKTLQLQSTALQFVYNCKNYICPEGVFPWLNMATTNNKCTT